MNEKLFNFHAIEQAQSGVVKLITREGKEVDISNDIWRLPYSTRDNATLNFKKITNLKVKDTLKEHVADRLKRISTHAGYAAYQDIWREVLKHWKKDDVVIDTESYLIDFELC